MEMIELRPAVAEPEHPAALPHPKGDIRFEHVSFHYEDSDENVLEDVSFCIGGGQTVAFAGSSGIGKTTVVSLIARFYDACSGRVLIDGADIRTLSLRTLRQTVGIVQQEVYILAPSAKTSATAAKTPPTPRSSRPPSWPGCMRSSLRSRTAMTAWWAQRGLCCPAGSGSG